jgi:hypothetical protein
MLRKAMSPHFGFFKLLIELVDGPIDQESAPARIFPDVHVFAVVDPPTAEQSTETASAA